MTPENRIAYIQGQIVCAQIELEAMKTANEQAKRDDFDPIYVHGDFMSLQEKYTIAHNAVIGYLAS